MQVFLWFLLFLLVVAGVVLAVRAFGQRRDRERLWGSLDGEPSLPAWNEDSLGVGPVRVHTEAERHAVEQRAAPPVPAPSDDEESLAPAHEALLDLDPPTLAVSEPAPPASDPPPTDPAPDPIDDAPDDAPEADRPDDVTDDRAPDDGPRPMRPRPEWWEEDAPGTGPLLRSLVVATGGSAALVRPDPSDDGYLVLAAAGPASSALHAHRQSRRFAAHSLTDLPREAVTVVLGSDESGVLPGMEPGAVGETAVRALAPSPAPRRLLVVDVPTDHPLDSRAEHLLNRYADLLADILGLPLEPPPSETPGEPSDPVSAAMEAIGAEIATARETGRSIALALVVPYEAEALQEADPEAVTEREAALRQRVAAVPGTIAAMSMGALVIGAVCDAEADRAEHWVRDLARSGTPLRIGMALYGPRHVTADLLRQDAVRALSETYTGEDTCVILG